MLVSAGRPSGQQDVDDLGGRWHVHRTGRANAMVLEPAGGGGRRPEALLLEEFYRWLTVGPEAEPACSGDLPPPPLSQERHVLSSTSLSHLCAVGPWTLRLWYVSVPIGRPSQLDDRRADRGTRCSPGTTIPACVFCVGWCAGFEFRVRTGVASERGEVLDFKEFMAAAGAVDGDSGDGGGGSKL